MTPRKNHYESIEDLYDELDHEGLFDGEETDLLDEEDLALLHGPKPPASTKKPAKKPAKKLGKKPAVKKPKKQKR